MLHPTCLIKVVQDEISAKLFPSYTALFWNAFFIGLLQTCNVHIYLVPLYLNKCEYLDRKLDFSLTRHS